MASLVLSKGQRVSGQLITFLAHTPYLYQLPTEKEQKDFVSKSLQAVIFPFFFSFAVVKYRAWRIEP